MLGGMAKGVLLVHLRDYAVAKAGQSEWDRALASVGAEDQKLFKGLLLSASWYPVGSWNRVLSSYLTLCTQDPARTMTAFADHVAEADMNSLIRFVLKLGSPEFILKRTGMLWARYFNLGTFTAEEASPKKWNMFLDAPLGENEGAGKWTCGPGVAQWLTRGLIMSGVPTGKVEHVKCRFEATNRCQYQATW